MTLTAALAEVVDELKLIRVAIQDLAKELRPAKPDVAEASPQ